MVEPEKQKKNIIGRLFDCNYLQTNTLTSKLKLGQGPLLQYGQSINYLKFV